MKKVLLTIALAILISGCNNKASKLSEEMSMARDEAACHYNGGVHIYSNFMFKATCKDGTRFDSHSYSGELVSEYLVKIKNKKGLNNEKECR